MMPSFNDYMFSFLSDYTSKHKKILYDTSMLNKVTTVAAQDFFIRKGESAPDINVKVKIGAGVCIKSEKDNSIVNPYNVTFKRNSNSGNLVADDVIFYNIYIYAASFSIECTIITPDVQYLKIDKVDDITF